MHKDKRALPLAGIKVVEMGQNLAGPFCGQVLGALGADVVKIERPDGGDDCRGWGPPFPGGMGTAFQVMNPNKRSVTLDVTIAEDRQWLQDFIGASDVLIHNMRPGVMKKIGLDGERLRGLYPRLVYAGISGFGSVGPLKDRPGYDAVVQALAGVFYQNGDPASRPSRVGPSVLDFGSGMWAVIGILAALRQRDQTGEGSLVDTSLLETAMCLLGPAMATFSATGKAPARQRAGIAKVVLFEAFETADSEIIFAAANDRLFAKLALAVGMPQLSADARFKTNADRQGNKGALMDIFTPLMKTRTTADWLARIEAQGVPCSEINTLEKAIQHPQAQALGMGEVIAETGLRISKLPLRFDGERLPTARHAPRLGEHTAEVKAEAAGEKNRTP
ncbi:MAG: CoA transferase [Pseudomonadota bacterium]